jgi:hypothetical protein
MFLLRISRISQMFWLYKELYSVVLYARKIYECLIERNLVLSISSIISKCDIRHSLLTKRSWNVEREADENLDLKEKYHKMKAS